MRLTLTINIINTTMNNKKNILISSKDSKLSELLYECLSDFNVKYLDLSKIDVNSHESYNEIFKGVNIYIHLCHGGFKHSDTMKMIDYHTRITYDILFAAGKENVDKVFAISTLDLFKNLESNLTVTENWELNYPASEIDLLCANLAENVCKEFARDKVFEVINLRLGNIQKKDKSYLSKTELKNKFLKLVNFDNDEFEKAKAAQNEQFVSARKKGPNWINLHLQDSFEGQKYLTSKIKNLLDPEVKI